MLRPNFLCVLATTLIIWASGCKATTALGQNLLQEDPISCARMGANLLGSPLCQYDLGAYQVARAALAVEMLSAAMSSAGLTASTKSIQRDLFRDIAKFGIHSAVVGPAMGMVDLSSLSNSPFGERSEKVKSQALLAIEYLSPGMVEKLNLGTTKEILEFAGVTRLNGPADFSSYMSQLSGKSIGLDDFRLFSAPSGSQSVFSKKPIPADAFGPGVPRNAASDFKMPADISGASNNPIPLAMALVGTAAIARAQETTLIPSKKSQGGVGVLESTPFSGAFCPLCQVPVSFQRMPESMFPGGVPIGFAEQQLPPSKNQDFPLNNGMQLMQAERGARRTSISSQENLAAAKAVAASTSSSMLAGNDLVCTSGCATKETIRTVGMLGYDTKELATSKNSQEFSDNLDLLFDNYRNNMSGEKMSKCVDSCLKDGFIGGKPEKSEDDGQAEGTGSGNVPEDDKEGGVGGEKPDQPKPAGGAGTSSEGVGSKTVLDGNQSSTEVSTTAAPEGLAPGSGPPRLPIAPECANARCGCEVSSSGFIGRCGGGLNDPMGSATSFDANRSNFYFSIDPNLPTSAELYHSSASTPTPKPFQYPDQSVPAYSAIPPGVQK
ncbi:hypothetical protein [Pseudorhodoferax sp. Leaf267]|uniref:hypothetical protein n=1 Tax=Pseudorhodoferax sp. Leaf267 TaxID=1736316 RepID=UPI0012E1CFB4|nr:hypothetical protein [Pseudorhodoferax sp. Leaf267]